MSSLKDNLLNTKARIVSIRNNLVQTLKDKNVIVDENSTLSVVASAVSNITIGGGGIDTSDGNAEEYDIVKDKIAYANNKRIVGKLEESNITINGKTVVISKGYVKNDSEKSVSDGDITIQDDIVTVTEGYVQSETININKGFVSVVNNKVYISKGYLENNEIIVGNLLEGMTITPSTNQQTILAESYLLDDIIIQGDSNLISSNIVSGKSIFGVEGTANLGIDTSDANTSTEDVVAGKVFYNATGRQIGTMSESAPYRNENIVVIPKGQVKEDSEIVVGTATQGMVIMPSNQDQTAAKSGSYLVGAIVVEGDINLSSENIVKGKSIFGVEGNAEVGFDTAEASTVTVGDVSQGLVFYNAEGRQVGELQDVEVTVDKDIVNIPAGRIRNSSTVTVQQGSVVVDDESNKIVVTEGWVSEQTIELPKIEQGSNIVLGMVGEDMNFQKLSFDGHTPSNDGETIAVEDYSTWKGTIELENNVNTSGSIDFYRCSSVGGEPSATSPQDATSNTGGDYVITASSAYSSDYEPWKAFSGAEIGNSAGWFCSRSDKSPWIQINFASAKKIISYQFSICWDSGQQINSWTLQGSNDGNSWTTIDSREEQQLDSSQPTFSGNVSAPANYTWYRLNIGSTQGFQYIGVQGVVLYQLIGEVGTWNGYKAVWSEEDGYSFEETVTENLSYGSALVPVPGGVYDSNARIEVSKLFESVKPITTNDTACLIYIDGSSLTNQALAPNKHDISFGSGVNLQNGVINTPHDSSGRITTTGKADGYGGTLTEWTWDFYFISSASYACLSGHSDNGWCLEASSSGNNFGFRGTSADLGVVYNKGELIGLSMQWDNGVLHVWDKGKYVGTCAPSLPQNDGRTLGIGCDGWNGNFDRMTDQIKLFRFSNKARYTPGVDFELPEGFIE